MNSYRNHYKTMSVLKEMYKTIMEEADTLCFLRNVIDMEESNRLRGKKAGVVLHHITREPMPYNAENTQKDYDHIVEGITDQVCSLYKLVMMEKIADCLRFIETDLGLNLMIDWKEREKLSVPKVMVSTIEKMREDMKTLYFEHHCCILTSGTKQYLKTISFETFLANVDKIFEGVQATYFEDLCYEATIVSSRKEDLMVKKEQERIVMEKELEEERRQKKEAEKKAEEEAKRKAKEEGELKMDLSKIPPRPPKTIRDGAGCVKDNSKKVAEWEKKYGQFKKLLKQK